MSATTSPPFCSASDRPAVVTQPRGDSACGRAGCAGWHRSGDPCDHCRLSIETVALVLDIERRQLDLYARLVIAQDRGDRVAASDYAAAYRALRATRRAILYGILDEGGAA